MDLTYDRNCATGTLFTAANEIGTFIVDWGDGDANPTQTTYTMVYDAAGNLTDDQWSYENVYDAWNRLRKVNNQSAALVAEFTYNGMGHRVGWHYDVHGDGTVESTSDDPWMYLAYDDAWRVVAMFRGSASATLPYEQFTNHNAGLDGRGGSSYIDAVVLRDRDKDLDAFSTLEERRYYCQNWRADVSAILTDTGKMAEWVKYSAYGVPFGLPAGDTDSDGDWDATDAGAITGSYDVRKDADLNGTVDGTVDVNHANSILPGGGYQTLGRNVMTSTGVKSRKGYAGYELDPSLWGTADKGRTFWHVRHRVLDSGLGRWVQRYFHADSVRYAA